MNKYLIFLMALLLAACSQTSVAEKESMQSKDAIKTITVDQAKAFKELRVIMWVTKDKNAFYPKLEKNAQPSDSPYFFAVEYVNLLSKSSLEQRLVLLKSNLKMAQECTSLMDLSVFWFLKSSMDSIPQVITPDMQRRINMEILCSGVHTSFGFFGKTDEEKALIGKFYLLNYKSELIKLLEDEYNYHPEPKWKLLLLKLNLLSSGQVYDISTARSRRTISNQLLPYLHKTGQQFIDECEADKKKDVNQCKKQFEMWFL